MTQNKPHPFIKWAGGKTKLLPELVKRINRISKINNYYEPFLGGGSLFFKLLKQKRITSSYLSDLNNDLINTYRTVRDHPEELINLLKEYKDKHSKEFYYEIRSMNPDNVIERSARFIYLNKTCYNGLCRVNKKGQFNVPMGNYKNPKILDENNLRIVSNSLKDSKLIIQDFEESTHNIKLGDFVYFDPPYFPISNTSNFTAYIENGFGINEQMKLFEVCQQLSTRGVYIIISNSNSDFIRDLYKFDFIIEEIDSPRRINSKSKKRGNIKELLIRNF